MLKAPIPLNDQKRLDELYQYEVLDTAREKIYDDITELAKTICGTKISVISLVDLDRQWFKSTQGLEAQETPREVSFCGHAIVQEEIFEIENALVDERFRDNPICVGAPNVVFYAGAPLITPSGHKLGTLCVIDDKPGKLNSLQRQLLQQLSKQVMNYLELHRKEKALQLSHIKLDRIVNHIPVMLSMYDEKGEFVWCNKGWERELGWTESEMKEKDVLSEFYPDPKARREVLDFMMSPGQGWREFRTRTKHNNYIYTSWANVSLPNGWTVGIGKNIDERKKSQEAMELLYQRNKLILRGAGLGSWDWWLETNQVAFDELWCEMLGLDFHKIEMKLSTWQDRVHPDDLEQCLKDIQKHLQGETDYYENIHRMRHADGHWVYILDRGRISERDTSGKPTRFTGSHFDVTNQKRIEQSLLDYKRKTESIFESSHDAILLWHDGVFLECNRKGLEIFGYDSIDEMRHIHPADLSPEFQPDGRPSLEASLEVIEFLKVHNTHRFEWVHKRKNGETFEVDVMISIFELDNRRINQVTIRDLSKERREQRLNLSFYNALLEMSNLDIKASYLEKIQTILKKVAKTIDCQQVSFWDYLADDRAIESVSLYDSVTDSFTSNTILDHRLAPSYFSAILESHSIIAHDVSQHPATAELLESYLKPLGIASMMDQVVKSEDSIRGVLCLEHMGASREWSVSEQAFTKAVADIISIILKDESLKKSQKILEDVGAMAGIGGWEYNLKTKKQTWTDETYRINDLEPGREVSVEEGISYYAKEDIPRIEKLFTACVEQGTPYQEDFKITTIKNNKKWVRAKGAPVYDSEGKIEAVRGVFQDITAAKERELELSQTRDRLKRIVDSSPTVIYECQMQDDRFITTYLSHQVVALTGYLPEDFMFDGPMNFSDLILPEDRQQTLENLALAIKADGLYEHRYRMINAKGEVRWVLDKGSIDLKTNIMSGVLLDVSNEVSLVQNLRNVKEALNELAIIAITDTNGVITFVNKIFEEISGYKSHELIGKTHRLINSGSHPPEFFTQLWATITAGQVWRGLIKNVRKDGEYYYVDTTIHPVKNESGKIVEFLGVRREVTHKVREERINNFISSLRASFINSSENSGIFYETALKLLLELAESSFGFMGEVVQDKQGPYLKTFVVTDISWSPEIKKFYDDNHEKGFEFRNLKTLFGEVVTKFETLISNDPSHDPRSGGLPPGHPKLEAFACFPLMLSSQKKIVIGIANRRNGYFKNFEEFLAPALTVLAEMLDAIRLKESLRIQTLISEHNSKLATIGQLAAGVGHEINNPLAIIKGILMMAAEELQSNGQLSESVRKKFNKIDISIDRIANIVKGLKTFSRSGESELNFFDLKDLLQEVDGLFSEIYSRDGIELEFDYDPHQTYTIFGNRGRVQQVFVNLIANGRDALEGVATPKLRVTMKLSGNQVHLSVSDNGHGIPKDITDRIFDPFFTTKDVNKGTGIGLSLVLTIITEHDGEIRFDSTVGEGTTFFIKLPLRSEPSESKDVIETQHLQPVKNKLRALVVDDEEDLRVILSQILTRLGFEVESAVDGVSALEVLGVRKFDLVISDSKMPQMSGLELLEKIQHKNDLQAPRFILVSGDLDLGTHVFGDNLKPDDVLLKPFRIELIQSKIAALFPELKN